MDIQSDATNTSRTDMRLAMHAMGAAAQDRETQFIVVSDKDDFLPLVRSLQVFSATFFRSVLIGWFWPFNFWDVFPREDFYSEHDVPRWQCS